MTFRAQISVVFSFFLLLPFALVGCSGPSFVPLEGVLTLDGEAVEGATVCLTPKNREVGRDAAGTTDANGRFVVSTGSDPGCIVGEYSISVLKIEQSGDSIATMRAKNVFPEQYADPASSGLSVDVRKNAEPLKLDLTN
ncbi:MAG: carboxypeptidase regulatory-like domain-containing protein [Thermoguttaceae bacterium]|nr:carboxypeptidase regulatory-like domain-containing protein [Thermoguttaceae bacterium]MBQ7111885.1 carboxypeptidase regulatory-like domain-containing protein [Thermoguttaceae bacterium]